MQCYRAIRERRQKRAASLSLTISALTISESVGTLRSLLSLLYSQSNLSQQNGDSRLS